MTAATTRPELLAITAREFDRLTRLLDQIDTETAMRPGPDGQSIRDAVGHRAAWIDMFLGWVADVEAGRPVHLPAEGYQWNDLPRLSAGIRQAQSHMSWSEARALLSDRHAALIHRLETMDDADLYDRVMPCQMAGQAPARSQTRWTVGRYAEASGARHYRSAAKYIRACLRALQSAEGGG